MESLKSLGMKLGKVYQSKTTLKNDAAIQFEPTKNVNIFKDFYSDLAGTLVRNLPVAFNKFNNNSMKQCYKNKNNLFLSNRKLSIYRVYSLKQHNIVEYLGCHLDSDLNSESMACIVLKKIGTKLYFL